MTVIFLTFFRIQYKLYMDNNTRIGIVVYFSWIETNQDLLIECRVDKSNSTLVKFLLHFYGQHAISTKNSEGILTGNAIFNAGANLNLLYFCSLSPTEENSN